MWGSRLPSGLSAVNVNTAKMTRQHWRKKAAKEVYSIYKHTTATQQQREANIHTKVSFQHINQCRTETNVGSYISGGIKQHLTVSCRFIYFHFSLLLDNEGLTLSHPVFLPSLCFMVADKLLSDSLPPPTAMECVYVYGETFVHTSLLGETRWYWWCEPVHLENSRIYSSS